MNLKEKVAELRKEIKAAGYTTKQVSVRSKYVMYDDSIRVTIKDLNVNKKLIEEIADKYESIRYDEYCGEVLQGCNTFVNVEIDYSLLIEAQEDYMEIATQIYNNALVECENNYSLYTAIEDNRNVVFYQPHYCNGNTPTISLNRRPENYKELGCYGHENITRSIATCPENIAMFLVECKYQHGVNIA